MSRCGAGHNLLRRPPPVNSAGRRESNGTSCGSVAIATGSYERPVTTVREGGVEPPRPFGHTDLNRARLPIPPLARVAGLRLSQRRDRPQPSAGPRCRGSTCASAPLRSARRVETFTRPSEPAPRVRAPTATNLRRPSRGCPAPFRAATRNHGDWVPSRVPFAVRSNRWRSLPPCSGKWTIRPRSSPASAGWCPTPSTWNSPRPTSTGCRRTTRRWPGSPTRSRTTPTSKLASPVPCISPSRRPRT